MMTGMSRRRPAIAAVLAAAAAAATDVAYISLIHAQDATDPRPGIVPFISTYIAAIAVAAALGAVLIVRGQKAAATTLLAAATTGSVALGVLAIFSIGAALFITAVLLVLAGSGVAPSRPGPAGWVPFVGAGVVSLGVLAAGFAAYS